MATNRTRYPELSDKDWLVERYVNQMQSIGEIANELGCLSSSVARALKRTGVVMRTHTSKFALLNDKEWLRKTYIDDGLSTRQIAAITGATKGNVYSAIVWAGITPRNSSDGIKARFPDGRAGDRHPRWKGGRHELAENATEYKKRIGIGGRRIASGYIYIYRPNHPRATKQGLVMEHRLIAEEHIGRLLEKDEIVHHLNGNKQDNRWENLEVTHRSEHVSKHFGESFMYEQLKEELEGLYKHLAELEAEIARLKKVAGE